MRDAAGQLTYGLHFLGMAQAGFGQTVLGDVARQQNHGRLAEQQTIQVGGSYFKITLAGLAGIQLVLEALRLAGRQRLMDHLQSALGVFRRQDFTDQPALERGGIGIQQLRLGQNFEVASVLVQHQQQIGNGVDDGAQARRAFLQGFFVAPARGDVAHEKDRAQALALVFEQRVRAGHGEDRAVLALEYIFVIADAFAGEVDAA